MENPNTQIQPEPAANQPPTQTPPAAPVPSKVSPEFLKKAGIIPKEPTKPAEPPPPEPPPAPADEPPQPTPEPTDGAPKPKKTPKVAKGYAQPPPATIEQITAAATAAATAAVKANAPQPAPPPELNPEDQRQIQVYEQMAKMNPEKYKDLPANATKFLHELDRLETEWDREHPGETFDSDGTISASLEQKFNLSFSQDDFDDAKIERKIAPMKEELETTKKKLAEAETAISTEAVQETMQRAVADAKTVLKEELGFKDDDLTKLVEDEPYVGKVVQQEMQAIENIVAAAHIAFAGGSHPNADQIGALCANYEQAMMQLPPDEQRDEHNRQFITRSQYISLPPDQRRQIDKGTHQSYWGMNAPTAAAIGTQIILDRAKKLVETEKERASKYLEKHGVKKAAAPPPPVPKAELNRATPAPNPPAPRPRQVSPPSTNPTASPQSNNGGIEASPQFKQRFLSKQSFGSGTVPAARTG
jgi:hypothetical protein